MTSAADPPPSPRSGKAIANVSSSWSRVAGSPSALNTDPPSPELQGMSPRKASVGPAPAGLDHGAAGNVADAVSISTRKKSAWNFPSNGASGAGSIIDTVSWPALSESAKFSSKSTPSDFPKPLSEVSVSAPPGSSTSSSSSKQAPGNQNTCLTQNLASPARQKSMKRGAVPGGSSNNTGSSNGGITTPHSLQVSEANQSVPGQLILSGSFAKGLQNKYSNGNNEKDHSSKAGGFSSQSFGHFGGGRRGSTAHHNNYGNKRDFERGGYEWSHQNFGRDVNMQQPYHQRGVRPFQRPPMVVAAPFIAPPLPPLRSFSNHIGFSDFAAPVYYVAAPPPPDSLRGIPFVPQPAPTPAQVLFFPAPDPQRALLVKQIDYYFSPENLCKDPYLRKNMDENGWVPISLIAGFNRVKQLTNSIQYILDTIQLSTVVEVQGEKIRKRNDWMTWLLHRADRFGSAPGRKSPMAAANYENLEGQFQKACLEDSSGSAVLGGSAAPSANQIVPCQ